MADATCPATPGRDARLIAVDDPAWDEVVGRCGADFYHRRPYHRLAQQVGEGEAWLALFEEEARLMAWPYLRRAIEGSECFDATSVYGYTGPIHAGPDPATGDGFAARAWSAFRRAWAGQHIVSLFTRLHPLLGNDGTAVAFTGEPGGPEPALVDLGRSVSMDLTLSTEERRAGYDKETRYEIRRARRQGLDVGLDPGFDHLGALVALYRETMLRNGAEDRYLFSAEYFEQLVAALGPAAQLMVARLDGEVAGGLLFVVDGEIAQAHLTGVSDRHLRLSPLKVLLDDAAERAQALGATRLHLGAGRGGAEDSLFEFKRRIAPLEHRFVIGRWVLEHERYEALCGPEAAGSFFPAYRAPRAALTA